MDFNYDTEMKKIYWLKNKKLIVEFSEEVC